MSGVDTYSYSKLNFECMYEYYLNYVASQDEKLERTSNSMADLGTLCHKIFEDYSNGELVQFELKQKFLEEFDKKITSGIELFFDNGANRDVTETYKRQCSDFFEKYHETGIGKQIAVEEDFKLLLKVKDKTFIFRGIIDNISIDDAGEYHVIDYKSKSKFANKEEVYKYTRQLYLYSLYVKYRYGKFPKTLNFLQFKIDHMETINFNIDDLEESLNWAYSQIEILENEMFWIPKCLEENEKEKPDLFYSRNLCNYRFSCRHSPLYKGDENG